MPTKMIEINLLLSKIYKINSKAWGKEENLFVQSVMDLD